VRGRPKRRNVVVGHHSDVSKDAYFARLRMHTSHGECEAERVGPLESGGWSASGWRHRSHHRCQTVQWSDVIDIDVSPAVSAEEGLKIGPEAFGRLTRLQQ
jgi:hypothetical protein